MSLIVCNGAFGHIVHKAKILRPSISLGVHDYYCLKDFNELEYLWKFISSCLDLNARDIKI
jgi:hypothetical protein